MEPILFQVILVLSCGVCRLGFCAHYVVRLVFRQLLEFSAAFLPQCWAGWAGCLGQVCGVSLVILRRIVTSHFFLQFLFIDIYVPFLPQALSESTVTRTLSCSSWLVLAVVFEKFLFSFFGETIHLLTMTVNGKPEEVKTSASEPADPSNKRPRASQAQASDNGADSSKKEEEKAEDSKKAEDETISPDQVTLDSVHVRSTIYTDDAMMGEDGMSTKEKAFVKYCYQCALWQLKLAQIANECNDAEHYGQIILDKWAKILKFSILQVRGSSGTGFGRSVSAMFARRRETGALSTSQNKKLDAKTKSAAKRVEKEDKKLREAQERKARALEKQAAMAAERQHRLEQAQQKNVERAEARAKAMAKQMARKAKAKAKAAAKAAA